MTALGPSWAWERLAVPANSDTSTASGGFEKFWAAVSEMSYSCSCACEPPAHCYGPPYFYSTDLAPRQQQRKHGALDRSGSILGRRRYFLKQLLHFAFGQMSAAR